MYSREYNYILISYIYSNLFSLGEKKSVLLANQYMNIIYFGCKYKNQNEIIKMCPFFIKVGGIIPYWF